MLKSILSKVLADLQEKFLDDFEQDEMKLSFSKGDIRLREVSVKEQLIENVHPLLSIDRVVLQNVSIKFSVAKLRHEPIVVDVDGVFVLISPKLGVNLTVDEIVRFAALENSYKQRIALILQGIYEEGFSLIEKYKTSKLMRHYLNGILKNIKIAVSNTSVRYENAKPSFCLESMIRKILIDTIELKALDGRTVEVSTSVKDDIVRFTKKIQCNEFAVWLENDFQSLHNMTDKEKVISLMRETIKRPPSKVLFGPLSIKILLHIDAAEPTPEFQGPFVRSEITMNELKLELSCEELSLILTELEEFALKINIKQRLYRPKTDLGLNWWGYLLEETSNARLNNSLMYSAYIELFSQYYIGRQLAKKKDIEEGADQFQIFLNKEEYEVMELLHEQFSLHDIVLCRILVINDLRNSEFRALNKQQFKLQLTEEDIESRIRGISQGFSISADYPDYFIIWHCKLLIQDISLQFYSEKAALQTECKEIQDLFQVNVKVTEVDFALRPQGRFVLQSMVEAAELMECISGLQAIVLRTTEFSAQHISKLLEHISDSQVQTPFISFNIERSTDAYYDIKMRAEIGCLFCYTRPEIFLIAHQIKADFARLHDEEKNHEFVMDFVRNLFFKEKEQKREIAKKSDPTVSRKIIQMRIEISSPVIAIPDRITPGKFLMGHLGQIELVSADLRGKESVYSVHDEYTFGIKQTCMFRIESSGQYAYFFNNLENIRCPEFTDVVKKQFLLLPLTFLGKISYLRAVDSEEMSKYLVAGTLSDISLSLNNITIQTFTKTVESIISGFERLELPFWHRAQEEDILLQDAEQTLRNALMKPQISVERLSNLLNAASDSQLPKFSFSFEISEISLEATYLDSAGSFHKLALFEVGYSSVHFETQPEGVDFEVSVKALALEDSTSACTIFELEEIMDQVSVFVLRGKVFQGLEEQLGSPKLEICCSVSKISIYYGSKLFNMLSLMESEIIVAFKPIARLYTKIKADSKNLYGGMAASNTFVAILIECCSSPIEIDPSFKTLTANVHMELGGIEVAFEGESNSVATLQILDYSIDFAIDQGNASFDLLIRHVELIDDFPMTQHHNVCLISSEESPLRILVELKLPFSKDYDGRLLEVSIISGESATINFTKRFVETFLFYINQQIQLFEGFVTKFIVKMHKPAKIVFNFDEIVAMLDFVKFELNLQGFDLMIPLSDRVNTGVRMQVESIILCRDHECDETIGYQFSFNNFRFLNNSGRFIIHDAVIKASLEIGERVRLCVVLEPGQEIVTDYHDIELLMQMTCPSNNLGYNIADDIFQNDDDINELEHEVAELFISREQNEPNEILSIAERLEDIKEREYAVDLEEIERHMEIRLEFQENKNETMWQELLHKTISVNCSLKRMTTLISDEELIPAIAMCFEGAELAAETVDGIPQVDLRIKEFDICDYSRAHDGLPGCYVLKSENTIFVTVNYTSESLNMALRSADNLIKLQYVEPTLLFALQAIRCEESQLDRDILRIREQCLRREAKSKKLKEILKINECNQREAESAYVDNSYVLHIEQYEFLRSIVLEQRSPQTREIAYRMEFPCIEILIPENAYELTSSRLRIEFEVCAKGTIAVRSFEAQNAHGVAIRYFKRVADQVFLELQKCQVALLGGQESSSQIILDNLEMSVDLLYSKEELFVKASQEFISEERNTSCNALVPSQIALNVNHSDIIFVMRIVERFHEQLQVVMSSFVESSTLRESSVVSEHDTSSVNQDSPSSQEYMMRQLSGELDNKNLLREEAKITGYCRLFKHEFPVYLNEDIFSLQFEDAQSFTIELLDSGESRELAKLQMQNTLINAAFDRITLSEVKDLHLNAETSVTVQTHNFSTEHWETLFSANETMLCCESVLTLPEDEESSVYLDLQMEFPKIALNLSPIMQRQVLNLISIVNTFRRDSSDVESCFYNPYQTLSTNSRSVADIDISPVILLRNCCRFDVLCDGAVIIPYESFKIFERRELINAKIASGEILTEVSGILCQDGHVQLVRAGDFDILIEVKYENRALHILFRERYYVRNMTKLPLYFGKHRVQNEYFSSYSSFCVHHGDYFSEIDLGSLPYSFQIEHLHFRLLYTMITNLGQQYYEFEIWPSYILINECVEDIRIDNLVIEPFCHLEAYVSLTEDFVVAYIEFGECTGKNITLGTFEAKPRGKRENNLNTTHVDDLEDSEIPLEEFKTQIKLVGTSRSCYLGVKRVHDLQAGNNGLFTYYIVIHPFFIARNCYALKETQQTQLVITGLTEEKYKIRYQCGAGEFREINVSQTQELDLAFMNGLSDCPEVLCESLNLQKTLLPIKCSGPPQTTPAAILEFSWTKNHLTRVITLLPSRIVRNHSGLRIKLFFGAVPLHCRDRVLELEDVDAPQIVPYSDSHIYVEHYNEMSCAFDLEAADCRLLVFKKYPLKLAIETTDHRMMQIIDIFDAEGMSIVQIVNKTNYTLEVKQCFDLRQVVKSKTPPHASIDTFDIDFQLIPEFDSRYFDFIDVSMPPVLEIKLLDQRFVISLAKIGKRKPMFFDGFSLFVEVDIRHERHIVVISTRPIVRETLLEKAERKFEMRQVLMKVSLRIDQLEFSYYALEVHNIDGLRRKIPVEMFRLISTGFELNVFHMKETTALNFQICDLQIFNVQPKCDYPLIFGFERESNMAVISLQAEKINKSFEFSGVQAEFARLRLNIDQTLLSPILQAISDFETPEMRVRAIEYTPVQRESVIAKYMLPSLPQLPQERLQLSALFIAILQVSAVRLTLNISISGAGAIWGESEALAFLTILTGSLSNVQNARLELSSFCLCNFVGQRIALEDQIKQFYLREMRYNTMQLLRSVGIFGSVGDSSWRIEASAERMFEADGLERLQSIALVGQSIVAGYGGAVSGAAQTIQNVAGAFAFDSEYSAEERRRMRDSHKSVRDALVNSAITAGSGFLGAVVGVVAEPVRGARDGFIGAVLGVGRGLAGLVAKPIAGIAGAIGHIGVAVSVAASGGDDLQAPIQRIWRSGSVGE